jgi:hypothetical protein
MRSLNSRENGSPLTRFGGQSRVKAASVGVVVVLAATLTIACGGGTSPTPGTPTAPTTPTPLGGSSSATNWMLTQRFVSVTGPDNCWVRQQRESLTGVGFSDLDMTVERSGGSITLKSQWFVEYVGTMNGSEFTTQQVKPLEGSGGRLCPDGMNVQQLPGVSNLSGRFSSDDQLLTASEVNSYRLATGEPVIYTWEWRATRR